MAIPPIQDTLLFEQFYRDQQLQYKEPSSTVTPVSATAGSSDNEYHYSSSSSSPSSLMSSSSLSNYSSPEMAPGSIFFSAFDQIPQNSHKFASTKYKKKKKTERLAKLNTSGTASTTINASIPINGIHSANGIENTTSLLFPSIDPDQFNPKSAHYIPLTASIANPELVDQHNNNSSSVL